MRMGVVVLYVVGFAIASTSASVLFKYAADAAGKKALWLFVLGNLIGALGPVAMMLALKRANPNLVYALCYGGAFTVLQLVSWRLFRQPLSAVQWVGVVAVGIGVWLLQLGHKPS